MISAAGRKQEKLWLVKGLNFNFRKESAVAEKHVCNFFNFAVFLRSPLAFVLEVLAYTDFSKLDCAPTLCFLQSGKVKELCC